MMTATNIHYELADRVQGLSPGGIGAMHLLARRTGLIGDIDRNLHLFKRHLPYHESDHVLNIAYNILAGGKRIEHLELRRNDEVYLNALGAVRIPDPTTAGDFCRRFSEHDVVTLMDAVNETRLRVWSEQPPEFFTQAIIEGDGTLGEPRGQTEFQVNLKLGLTSRQEARGRRIVGSLKPFRWNPAGNQSRPVEPDQQPEASLAWWVGDHPCEA